MQSTHLDKNRHDRKHFDCGIKVLNNHLQMMASQQSKRDNTRTFVIEESKNSEHIIGYYTLTMIAIELATLPSTLQKKHANVTSSGLVARLAVDKRYQKEGYGEWLLVDALKKLLLASDIVAFPFIVVDAKEGASEFYEKFGFRPLADEENRLYITTDEIRKSLGESQ